MKTLAATMWRWLALAAGAVVIAVGLSAATFTAAPREAVLLERGGHVVAGPLAPGLHWRIPLVEGVIRMDAGVRLDKGRVQVGTGAAALAARYAVLWRIGDARRFYQATGGDGAVVSQRLDAALAPALRRMMDAHKPTAFLTRPAATINTALGAAVQAPARKLGIDVLQVGLAQAQVPAAMQKQIGTRMAAEVGARAATSASSAASADEAAARADRGRAQAIMAAARRASAGIRGRSEGQAAQIYAKAAAQAPRFFRFLQALTSEEEAMSSHTRALVISTDSPWFKELRPSASSKQRHKS